MPGLAVLAAAAEVRQRPHPALLDPGQGHRGEGRGVADVEPAIAGEESWPRPLLALLGATEEEERDARAVFGRVAHLLHVRLECRQPRGRPRRGNHPDLLLAGAEG